MAIKKPPFSSRDMLDEKRRVRGLPPRQAEPTKAEAPPTPVQSEKPAPQLAAPEPSAPASEPPAASAPAPTPTLAGSAPAAGGAGEGTQVLTITVPTPAPGVSPSFDAVSAQQGPTRALQALIRKAMDAYEPTLLDGSFKAQPASYEAGGGDVRTTRRISAAAFAVAREHFDPYDVATLTGLSRMIATAALAAYFQREKRR